MMSNGVKMGLRYAPMAFTEQGVAMLSSVLKSDRAIQAKMLILLFSIVLWSRYPAQNVGLNITLPFQCHKEIDGY